MHPPNRRAPVSRAFDRAISRHRTAGLIGLALVLVLVIFLAAGCGETEDSFAAPVGLVIFSTWSLGKILARLTTGL